MRANSKKLGKTMSILMATFCIPLKVCAKDSNVKFTPYGIADCIASIQTLQFKVCTGFGFCTLKSRGIRKNRSLQAQASLRNNIDCSILESRAQVGFKHCQTRLTARMTRRCLLQMESSVSESLGK